RRWRSATARATRDPSGRRRSAWLPSRTRPAHRWPRPLPSRELGASQTLLPRLAHEIVAEARMPVLVREAIAGRLVEAPRGEQHAVRPQRDRAIAGPTREALALGDQVRADADAACRGLDEQQPQLRHRCAALDEEHAADALAVLLRDPATLARRVVALDESRDDGGHEGLEPLIPSEVLRVERAVTLHDPPHVPRTM